MQAWKYLSPAAWALDTSHQKNPADVAAPYLDQQEDLFTGKNNPWAPEGMQDKGGLGQQFYNMGTDPTSYYNNIASGYEESPGFQDQLREAQMAASGASAAAGVRGTPGDVLGQGKLAGALRSQDFQNWYNNVMGIHDTGLKGQSDQLGNLAGVYGSKAGLGYSGQVHKNEAENASTQQFLQLLMAALGAGKTGGYM